MSTSRATIRSGLVTSLDPQLVDELLDAYEEAKSNFYLGGLRLSAVEGGRFCEAAFRLLQQRAFGRFDPLGRQLKTETIIQNLALGADRYAARLGPSAHPASPPRRL